ncbi:gluconokinase [Simiduia curdlanivorans]|uniref:Gluconokinase n=1 Tax=Simiduia curdlanivorans TaxID=1492769 RepID=A0ABV8V216_9GAMM|nr:gluconokinase [Simiduia curdlanivorans]MDN3640140.1 gluconokinase [Simiduia curdlanivorans]
MDKPSIFIVMGVSGCGKSSLGAALAEALAIPFYEGDEFHPQSNINKMAEGIPLQDADRWPWLMALRDVIKSHLKQKHAMVLSCSALKRSYRDLLGREPAVIYICLQLDQNALHNRVDTRTNHFMPSSLVLSQLQALELPQQDERSITLDATQPLAKLVQTIFESLETKMCGASA